MTYESRSLNKTYPHQSPERRDVQKLGFLYSDQKAGSKTEETKSIAQQVYDKTWFLHNKNESEKIQENWNSWLKELKEVKNDIRELQLIHKGFQNDFGANGTSIHFKDYSHFIENYNKQSDECAKKVALFNNQIDDLNKKLPQGEPKIEKLPLPPKLEVLKTDLKVGNQHSHKSDASAELSEGQDLVVKTSDRKSTQRYWKSFPHFQESLAVVKDLVLTADRDTLSHLTQPLEQSLTAIEDFVNASDRDIFSHLTKSLEQGLTAVRDLVNASDRDTFSHLTKSLEQELTAVKDLANASDSTKSYCNSSKFKKHLKLGLVVGLKLAAASSAKAFPQSAAVPIDSYSFNSTFSTVGYYTLEKRYNLSEHSKSFIPTPSTSICDKSSLFPTTTNDQQSTIASTSTEQLSTKIEQSISTDNQLSTITPTSTEQLSTKTGLPSSTEMPKSTGQPTSTETGLPSSTDTAKPAPCSAAWLLNESCQPTETGLPQPTETSTPTETDSIAPTETSTPTETDSIAPTETESTKQPITDEDLAKAKNNLNYAVLTLFVAVAVVATSYWAYKNAVL